MAAVAPTPAEAAEYEAWFRHQVVDAGLEEAKAGHLTVEAHFTVKIGSIPGPFQRVATLRQFSKF